MTADSTIIEACRTKRAFKEETATKAGNHTHQVKTDPDAKLSRNRKRQEPKLDHSGHVLVEKRNGIIVTRC